MRASTRVVACHSSVPSDSGASVGTVYARTSTEAMGAEGRAIVPPPLVLRIAFHHALLPRHLVQVVVVEHHDDQAWIAPAFPVLGDGDEAVDAIHLHGPVAHECHGDAIRVRELGRDRIRHAWPHGGE